MIYCRIFLEGVDQSGWSGVQLEDPTNHSTWWEEPYDGTVQYDYGFLQVSRWSNADTLSTVCTVTLPSTSSLESRQHRKERVGWSLILGWHVYSTVQYSTVGGFTFPSIFYLFKYQIEISRWFVRSANLRSTAFGVICSFGPVFVTSKDGENRDLKPPTVSITCCYHKSCRSWRKIWCRDRSRYQYSTVTAVSLLLFNSVIGFETFWRVVWYCTTVVTRNPLHLLLHSSLTHEGLVARSQYIADQEAWIQTIIIAVVDRWHLPVVSRLSRPWMDHDLSTVHRLPGRPLSL